jgi:hypothetical protein
MLVDERTRPGKLIVSDLGWANSNAKRTAFDWYGERIIVEKASLKGLEEA